MIKRVGIRRRRSLNYYPGFIERGFEMMKEAYVPGC